MQWNYCVLLLRKSKRDYYNNFNEKNISVWEVVKPLLSNKIISDEKITQVEGEKVIKVDQANAKELNNFDSNIIKHLEIPHAI